MSFNFNDMAQSDAVLLQLGNMSLGSPQSRHQHNSRTQAHTPEAVASSTLGQQNNSPGGTSQVKVEAEPKTSPLPGTPPKQNRFFGSLHNVTSQTAASSPRTPSSQPAGQTFKFGSRTSASAASSTFSFSPIPKTSPEPQSVFSFSTPVTAENPPPTLLSLGSSSTSRATTKTEPPNPQPVFSFGTPATREKSIPTAQVTPKTPLFSFGSPLTPPMTTKSPPPPSQPLFSFGTSTKAKSTPQTAQATPPAPLFSFGSPLTSPTRKAQPPSQPLFSFDAPAAREKPLPTTQVMAPASLFSFGSPLTPPSTTKSQTSRQPLVSIQKPTETNNILRANPITLPAPRFSPASPTTPQSTKNAKTSSIFAPSPFSPEQVRGGATNSGTPQAQEPIAQPPPPVTPYNAADEPAPAHTFFTPVFQAALKNSLNIATQTTTEIRNLTAGGLFPSDKDLSKLLQDAELLTKFQATDTRTIAVLGDSGEGKSSLINSLLHFPDVAQTGDIGSACTSVVTEYRQKKANNVAPIVIEVEYLSESGIKEIIRELLWSYRRLYLPGVESDETSEQDYAKYTRESEHAWSALKAAFGHKRQFTAHFAQDMSEGASDRIFNQLVEWAKEIEWPTGGTEGFWTTTAKTAEECVEHAKMFMQDKYWPFTKIIRVYLDSPVLKTGVVLADLPGLQDTNLARVRATQDYLIKCDNIFIVAKISRAITDQSLKSSLFYVLSRHVPMEWEQSGAQNFKIAVVCTKSEDLNLKAARTEFCGPTRRIKPAAMAQLDKEIEEAKSAGDRDRKKRAKKKQELLLIEARNNHVKENLKRVYSSEMEGKSLEVFCVSNKWYEKYCPKGKTEFVQASGVPELRRFCHTITADAQLSEAKHFLKSKLSTLLNSLDIWASSAQSASAAQAVKFNESIYEDFKTAKSEIMPLVAEFRSGFSDCFQDQIIKCFAQREQKWDEAAADEGRKWHSWHWTQYNAWCLNNGNHETLKRGREDWNAKIIWKMRMELEFAWDLVLEEVPEAFEVMLDGVKGVLDEFRTRVQVVAASEYVSRLVSGIDSQMESIEYKMQREQARFLTEVKSIRRYASDSNCTSYILKDMLPSYRSAAGQSGSGKAARQRSIVQGHIEGETIFPQLAIAISTSMNGLLAASEDILREIVSAALASIKRDLDMVFRSQAGLGKRSAADEKKKEAQLTQFASVVARLKARHSHLMGSIE